MAREIDVVYENGVFKPLEPVCLPEGHRLKLIVQSEPAVVSPEQALRQWEELRKAFADWQEEDWAEFEQTFKRGP